MDPVLHLTLRTVFSLLLASSAAHKWRDLARFREAIRGYRILPAGVEPAAAPAFALLETALALLAASGLANPAAGGAICALMLAYAAAIAINVRRGRTDIDCGCMGPAARVPLGWPLVLRNLALAAAAALLATAPSSRALGWLDGVGAAAAVLALAACWSAGERMLALAPRAAELSRRAA